MDGKIPTKTKNVAYAEKEMESDKKPNKSVEKKGNTLADIKLRHIDNTLKENMDLVDASLKSNQKHLLSLFASH